MIPSELREALKLEALESWLHLKAVTLGAVIGRLPRVLVVSGCNV
jgi:hypothetical protein